MSSGSATGSRSSPRPGSCRARSCATGRSGSRPAQVAIAAQHDRSPFTHRVAPGRPLRMPVAHGEGCYYADDATLDALERDGQVLFRYVDAAGRPAEDPADRANPNGSLRAIAGVSNRPGNVAGLMPHPERASEGLLGSDDGRAILESLVDSRSARGCAACPSRSRSRDGRRAAGRPGAPPPARPHGRRARRHPRPARARPDDLELAMFSVMWSEHCSYKSCKPCSRPCRPAARASSPAPARTPASISIGHGLAVAFKIESHNHPSAVEPFQGAATGVGGILRDIFTMGARPIAVLDALRFGDPASPRTRHLVDGVVRGVGGYGNCVGVPDRRRRARLRPARTRATRSSTPWRSACSRSAELTRAAAPGPGNAVVLFGSNDRPRRHRRRVGARVGDVRRRGAAKRPSVQVGDPFAEKLLIEASLELIRRGLVEGLQDLGRRRHHVRDVRDGGPGGHRDPASTSTRSRGASPAWRRTR